jgi:hypothetical protein
MKRSRFLLTAILLTAFPLRPLAAQEDAVRIGLQIIRVVGTLSGDASADENFWAGPLPPRLELRRAVTFFTRAAFRVGENRFDIDPKQWLWNGTPLPFPAAGATSLTLPENQIRLVSSPVLLVANHDTAALWIGSAEKIEYMVRRPNGLFELKTMPRPRELSIGMRVEKEGDGRVRLADMKIGLSLVGKREPIPGVTLPVGPPVLQEREYPLDVRLTPGMNYGVLLYPGEAQGVLILRLRVDLPGKNGPKGIK